MFDYFYGAQAEQFAFYRVPKVLFTNDRFKYLSAEAKTLYGILLDRVPLSAKNGWIDEQGRVYIICTIEEIMAAAFNAYSAEVLAKNKRPSVLKTLHKLIDAVRDIPAKVVSRDKQREQSR